MNENRIFALQERVAALARSVAYYETKREELLRRRQGAIDSVMVEIDDQLKVNATTLKVLRRTLAVVSLELESAQTNPMSG